MTPVERLRELVATGGKCGCARKMHLACQEELSADLRALLAEWEEQGKALDECARDADARRLAEERGREIERLKAELVEKDHKLACAWERRDEAEDRLAKVIEVGDRIVARNCGDAEAELWAKAKEKEQHGSSLL